MRVIDVDPDVDGLDALGNVVENAKNSKYSPILLSFYGKWNDSRRQCVDSVEGKKFPYNVLVCLLYLMRTRIIVCVRVAHEQVLVNTVIKNVG